MHRKAIPYPREQGAGCHQIDRRAPGNEPVWRLVIGEAVTMKVEKQETSRGGEPPAIAADW